MTPGDSPKQDKPTAEEGKGPDAKVEETAADATEAVAKEKAEEKAKPKPKRKPAAKKPAAKKAEGTAAGETGVEKEAAEAALAGAEVPGPDAEVVEAEAEAKPKRRSRAKKTEDAPAAEAEAAEAPAPAKPRTRRKPAAKEEAKPAPRRRRGGAPEPAVTVRATARFVRSSPRKARLITEHIKGKSVDEARAILAFSPRAVANDWRKLLESAIANAENNHDLVGDDLRVLNATADDGPTLKRFRPRAMGRATRIRKRTSHLTITLTPKE